MTQHMLLFPDGDKVVRRHDRHGAHRLQVDPDFGLPTV